jgi:hypothetical protein
MKAAMTSNLMEFRVRTRSGSDGIINSSKWVESRNLEYRQDAVECLIPSHPPPQAGCPLGDPGPLRVLTRYV